MGRCLHPAGNGSRLVGDPVDTLTGAVVDRMLDFRLTGFIELRWFRHYDSSQNHRSFSLGIGWAHEYDRSLSLDAEGILYEEPIGRSFRFPPLKSDGDEHALYGFRICRISSVCYRMFRHAHPGMEFLLPQNGQRARLTRLLRGEHEVRFRYDGTQKLVRIHDSTGRHIIAHEDEVGRLVRLSVEATPTKPGYLLVAYEYSPNGNLIATQNDKGHGYRFEYDDSNRIVLRRGRKGFQFYFKYDALGRCIRSMGDSRLYGVALEYKIPGRLTKVTRPDGGVWTYRFTQRGELEEIIDPLGGVQKFVRDASGRVILDIDPNGNATEFIYNAAGEPVAKIDPLGHRIPLPEDPNAPDPLSHRVATNAAEYEYGRLLNVDTIALPAGAQVRALPFPPRVKALVVVRSPLTQSNNPEKRFEIPPLRVLWWPEPKQGRVFDDFGKLTQQRDEFGRVREWIYDESGNVAEHIDFDCGRWKYGYGSWHFLQVLTNPLNAEVKFSYSAYGEVTSCIDAGGTLSEYRYDQKDRLVGVRRHGVVRETYARDAVGNLVAKYASDGRELLRLEIGPGNFVVKRTLTSGDEHIFQYDNSGRRLVASTKRDNVTFAYDTLGNTILDKRNGLGAEHRFQGWQKLAESVFFCRFVVRYVWDDDATLVITDPGGKSHQIHFYDNGIVERCFSNESKETSQYDNQGRCLFKCLQGPDGRFWRRRYYWSGEGELQRVEDNWLGEVHYEYDVGHRLCRRRIAGEIENYQFDKADNLIAQPRLSGVTLQEGNRLVTANNFNFKYNDRNHIASRATSISEIRYVYDSRDQLSRAEMGEGHWEAEYDALGRRTRKTWAGQTTEYYWDGDRLIAEVQSNGQLRLYIYADPIALTPLLFLDYTSLDKPVAECQRYFIFSDQIGTPCLVDDELGNKVWEGVVSPFGSVAVSTSAKIELNFRFPGHYFDAELGLHYNRFRYYDPALGRYLQSDPWGISGGYNLYAYCTNPLADVDVRGLGEESNPNCRRREEDAEGTGGEEPPSRRRMTNEELQSAADYIRNPNGDPRDFSTLTITEGMENGRPVYTVTSSRRPNDYNDGHNLTEGERARTREVFGPDVNTPVEGRAPPGEGSHHSEQRGMRATQDQTERRQASSNNTMGEEGNFGAACNSCAACQRNATDSSGNPNPVENVTGTVDNGGRTNNPRRGAWRNWS